jgi:hypothetical protein
MIEQFNDFKILSCYPGRSDIISATTLRHVHSIMDSLSDCTYNRYAHDITVSPDYFMWKPFYLKPDVSMSILGFDRVVCGVSDVIQGPMSSYIKVVNDMVIPEYTFEPLIPVPIVCWTTAQSLTYSRPNDIIMCMSNSDARNLIFAVEGSILCCNEEMCTLYIPAVLKRSVYLHTEKEELTCSVEGIYTRQSHHSICIPEELQNQARYVFDSTPSKIRVSVNHQPMSSDGYTKFCNATPVVSIRLESMDNDTDMDTNEPSEEVERRICVRLLGFINPSPSSDSEQQELLSTPI